MNNIAQRRGNNLAHEDECSSHKQRLQRLQVAVRSFLAKQIGYGELRSALRESEKIK